MKHTRIIMIITAAALLTGCAGSKDTSSDAGTDVSAVESGIMTDTAEPTVCAESKDTSSDAGTGVSAVESSIITDTAEPTGSANSADASTETTGAPSEKTSAVISADYADDMGTAEYDEYDLNSGELQTRVVFSTDSTVTDFSVLSLTYRDSDENGNITFDIQTLYTQSELTPERPLVAGLEFIGTIPNNGISYVDHDGTVRTFAVDMSGMDGSLFLWEI